MQNYNVTDNQKSMLEQVKKSTLQKEATKPVKENKKDNFSKSVDMGNNSGKSGTVRYSVEISWKTILLILSIVGGVYLGYKLLVLFAILFFAFAIASALLPLISGLRKKGLGKVLSMILVYGGGLLIVLGMVIFVAKPMQSQWGNVTEVFSEGSDVFYEKVTDLAVRFVDDVEKEELQVSIEQFFTQDLAEVFSTSELDASKAFGTVASVVTFIGYFIFSVVISVYIVYDHDSFIDLMLLRIVDNKKTKLVKGLIKDIEHKLGSWLLGQATLSLVIGILVWLMLTILGVKYALPFAIIAAMFEVVPSIGPTLAATPAIITVLLMQGPASALMVVGGYMIVQWLENTFIVPKIMGNATGLKPIVVILGVFIGFTLFGPIGTVLAVPVAVVIKILSEFYIELQKVRAEEV